MDNDKRHRRRRRRLLRPRRLVRFGARGSARAGGASLFSNMRVTRFIVVHCRDATRHDAPENAARPIKMSRGNESADHAVGDGLLLDQPWKRGRRGPPVTRATFASKSAPFIQTINDTRIFVAKISKRRCKSSWSSLIRPYTLGFCIVWGATRSLYSLSFEV